MEVVNKIAKGLFWCFHDFDEDNWVYKLVAFIGPVLRVGLLPILIPEPFQLVANLLFVRLRLPQWAFEILIRVFLTVIEGTFLGRFFYKISFATVGNMYEALSDAAWGSICYTIYNDGRNAMYPICKRDAGVILPLSRFLLYDARQPKT